MFSSFATTFAYHPRKYFLMYEPVDPPEVYAARIVEATGLAWETAEHKTAASAWPLVKQCVDTGTPLTCDWLDDFFIAGYCDAPDTSGRRIYTVGKWSLGEWMSWSEFEEHCARFGRFGRPAGNLQRPDLSRSILQRTLDCAAHDPRSNVPFMAEGRFGFDGMEAYAADVADLGKGPDYFDGAWLACHAINRQWHGRESAARWLSRYAQTQPPGIATHLRRAGELYSQSHDRWLEFRDLLSPGPGEELTDKWTDAQSRTRGAQLIREAIRAERDAVTALAAASRAME